MTPYPIGSTACWSCDGLVIHVTILATRQNFGRTDYQIAPVAGSETKWVQGDSLAPLNLPA